MRRPSAHAPQRAGATRRNALQHHEQDRTAGGRDGGSTDRSAYGKTRDRTDDRRLKVLQSLSARQRSHRNARGDRRDQGHARSVGGLSPEMRWRAERHVGTSPTAEAGPIVRPMDTGAAGALAGPTVQQYGDRLRSARLPQLVASPLRVFRLIRIPRAAAQPPGGCIRVRRVLH
jgi:hypothetical protein